jgi:hypothetical protein
MRALNLRAYDPHSVQKEDNEHDERHDTMNEIQETNERAQPTNSKANISNDTVNNQVKRKKEEKKLVSNLNLISYFFD